ncbi:MAG: alkyl sulfatase dimerization domain-containing protein [Oleiphilaceae bacterium]|nr:alkyl sulfatase dimerization domain-containing protein [Oleiphilaceae bacterium]
MGRISCLLLSLFFITACGLSGEEPPNETGALTPEALDAHSEEFREDVIEVTDGVHVAIGFGIANTIMIEGENGVTIVDTMESLEAAERIAKRFREITDKPVRAVVYTHSHPDHIHGTPAFLTEGQDVAIYAHESLDGAVDQTVSVLQPILTQRSFRMFGTRLHPDDRSNVGIGPFVDMHEDTTLQILRPTHTFSDELSINVEGVEMVLKHAPGETDDQVVVWLPEKKVLLAGDNFYRAFPNLYTIRGTSYRDPKAWADSLEMMRDLRAEYLVPSHSRPLTGQDEIYRHLNDYRDGIRYVYDQTIRRMNEGQTPDEIAHEIQLPPHLAESPFLQEFYGKPEWSARMIFTGELGWFDGNPSNLHPTPPQEKAERMAELAGGREALMAAVEKAAGEGDHQWVLELTDFVLRLEPENPEATQHRIAALQALASVEANPNARHYYLTTAAELSGELKLPLMAVTPKDAMLEGMPVSIFFNGMKVGIDGQSAWEVYQSVIFEFPDLDKRYTLSVRGGATELKEGAAEEADIHVRIDSLDFKRMLSGIRNPALAILQDFEYVKGGRIGFTRFMRLFQPDLEE